MASFQLVDIEKWNRSAQHHFFRNYDSPFFNITAPVDAAPLFKFTKKTGLSFFLSNLHCALKVANQITEFRYRFGVQGEVVCYDTIHGGSTILYDDNTFGFCYFDYNDDLELFCQAGTENIERQKQSKDLDPRGDSVDLIHFSTIPWVTFTSVQHARRFGQLDAVPKITFGKYVPSGDQVLMPMSVEVNHVMMDGYHVGLYFEEFQALIHSFDKV